MQQNAREEYTDEAFGRSEASKKRPKETEKKPLIIVLPTYNNTSGSDSGDYSLAIRLTENFHNYFCG